MATPGGGGRRSGGRERGEFERHLEAKSAEVGDGSSRGL